MSRVIITQEDFLSVNGGPIKKAGTSSRAKEYDFLGSCALVSHLQTSVSISETKCIHTDCSEY